MLMSSGGYAASSSGCVTRGRERLVRPDTPGQPNTLCSLDVMSWQRPNIGSRVTREGHARFWERPEVKFLRATRHYGKLSIATPMDRTELWIVFAPAPGPVGTGAGSTMHNYRACRNFIKSSGGR